MTLLHTFFKDPLTLNRADSVIPSASTAFAGLSSLLWDQDRQFASKETQSLRYCISQHPQIKDILFTGCGSLLMTSKTLRSNIFPLLRNRDTDRLSTVRLGTKSLAYWPHRFLSDPDSKSLLRLCTEIVGSGEHFTIQAHFSHPLGCEHPAAREAIRLIKMQEPRLGAKDLLYDTLTMTLQSGQRYAIYI